MRAPLGLKSKNENGFTIIEVMIVLAVASLIMLIVLLAVPALQRSTRNTNRTADATKTASAVSDCMSNRNNTVASCNTTASITGANGTLDTNSLKQLTTVTVSNTSPATLALGDANWPADTATIKVFFGEKCAADGASASTTGAVATQFVVIYNNEGGNGNVARCVST